MHGRETDFSQRETCIRVFRCHKGRTKRIVTEGSPDLFLTVAEVRRSRTLSLISSLIGVVQDNTVRQHDLRIRHQCNGRNCPPPLLKLPHELTTLALSPLTPYQFVVAGESPYVSMRMKTQNVQMVEAQHLISGISFRQATNWANGGRGVGRPMCIRRRRNLRSKIWSTTPSWV